MCWKTEFSSFQPQSTSGSLVLLLFILFWSIVIVVQLLTVSNPLRSHGLQQVMLPYPSLSPRVCSDSCPLNWWCHPTISSSITPSSCLQFSPASGSFSNELALWIRWPKYWSISFSIMLSSEYWGLISFRIDWFDLLTVQGTLKSLLQHHNLKASFFRRSAFFMVQLSHPYMTTGKTIALT